MIRLIIWTIVLLIAVGCATCGEKDMSIQDKYEQMYYPTVRIETEKGSGSGVVIDVYGGYSVILTARHVIEDVKKVRIRFYPSETEYVGEVTKVSKDHDLAIVMVQHKHDYTANLVKPKELLIFEETYKVGAALGNDKPLVTTGVVSEVWDDSFVTSSPIIWGDSGGGVYTKRDGEFILIGISTQISIAMGRFPVYHIGIAVDMFAVEEFLNAEP